MTVKYIYYILLNFVAIARPYTKFSEETFTPWDPLSASKIYYVKFEMSLSMLFLSK